MGIITGVALVSAGLPMPQLARADKVIAQLARPSPVNGFGNVLAWSDFAAGSYTLTLLVGDRVVRIPTAPEPVSFDASVGPGIDGQPVVVFSRCRRYRASGTSSFLFGTIASGCRIYRYTVRTGLIARLGLGQRPGESFAHPSEWRGLVAVSSAMTSNSDRVLVIALRSHRRISIRGGTLRPARASSISLVGSHLGLAWQAHNGAQTQITTATLAGSRKVLESATLGLATNPQIPNAAVETQIFGATLTDHLLSWLYPGDLNRALPSVVSSYDIATQKTTQISFSDSQLYSVVLLPPRLVYTTGSAFYGSNDPNGSCPCVMAER